MSWETKNGTRYYYVVRRINGRLKKTYVGGGLGAEAIAWFDQHDRHKRLFARDCERVDVDHLEKDRQRLQVTCRQVSVITALSLTAAGYHQHKRGQWRKKRQGEDMKQIEGPDAGPVSAPISIPATDRERRAMVQRAIDNPGDKAALAVSLAIVRAYPECEPMPMASSLIPVMERRIDDDPTGVRRECLTANVEGMREALSGANPTPLESMLIDRVLACWVHLAHCQEAASAKARDNVANLSYYYKRLESANRMYLASVKTLAEVRRLSLPTVNVAMPGAVQVNQGDKQINVTAGRDGR